ncbi:uncharacterized protein E0L32_006650 [Thyridium curvatum]|uniref:PLL-like beta propeller domain-containing protein n=1 Tax=Thyridium curvatum TaxID=1093900 RepID=A0A507AQ68_9PEZI|nr:uncharacterized protein E0L32_006650 [Thyridium curvatum]TPX13005.1 hypothetical protein E0L32_006650 [Thyridium curvatum]
MEPVSPVSPPGAEYSSLPEVVPGERQAAQDGGHAPERVPLERENESQIMARNKGWDTTDWETQKQKEPKRPWWKRRLVWIIAAVAIVVIALVVGLTVGLLTRKKGASTPTYVAVPKRVVRRPTQLTAASNNSTTPSPTPSSTTPATAFGTPTTFPADNRASVCQGTVCPSTLATAQLVNPDPSAPAFFVFGLGGDRAICFGSQPAAVVVNGTEVHVFAVFQDGAVGQKAYVRGSWQADWTNLQGNSINAPAACSWGAGNIELFATAADGDMTHRRFDGTSWSSKSASDPWDKFGGFLAAGVAALCPADERVDVVSYGSHADSLHDLGWMHYRDGAWAGWEGNSRPPGGSVGYRGDPAIVRVDDKTSGAVGIGSDGQMYYSEWSFAKNKSGAYSKTQSLGSGAFESTPFVIQSANRIDVLAVGKGDRLMHKAQRDGVWANDWEDLGGYFNSAPAGVQWLPGGWIAVFGIGPEGRLIHGNFSLVDRYFWGNGTWYDDGGDLSTKWLRAGPAR